MKASLPVVAVLSLMFAGSAAVAQTVYRCGNSYSQSPCPAATAIDAADPRTAQQKSQSEAAVRRDAKVADAMEKDRLKQEARAAPALIMARKEPPKAEPVRSGKGGAAKKKGKKKEPEDFTATDGKSKSAEKKKVGKPKAA